MHPSTAALSTQLVRRGRFGETIRLRRQFWDEGHDIKADQGIPPGAYLIRDPDAPLEKIPQRVTAATRLDEQSFRELTGDKDVTDWKEALKNIVMTPDELGDVGADMKNVRWIEPWKVESLVRSVFPSSPTGRGAAGLGMANTLTRLSNIYLRPIRYLTGNVPANVVLVALTHPTALPKSMNIWARPSATAGEVRKRADGLAQFAPRAYNAIRAEWRHHGGAGLPEFYTQANAFEGERKLNRWSAEVSDRLGEIADQPFRVAVWQSWAKRYGYERRRTGSISSPTRDPGGNRPCPALRRGGPDQGRDRAAHPRGHDRLQRDDAVGAAAHRSLLLPVGVHPWLHQVAAHLRPRVPRAPAGVGLAASAVRISRRQAPLPRRVAGVEGSVHAHRPDGTRLDFSSWNPISRRRCLERSPVSRTGNIKGLTNATSPDTHRVRRGGVRSDPARGWKNRGGDANLRPELGAGGTPGCERRARA
jgi:hypothetical protein